MALNERDQEVLERVTEWLSQFGKEPYRIKREGKGFTMSETCWRWFYPALAHNYNVPDSAVISPYWYDLVSTEYNPEFGWLTREGAIYALRVVYECHDKTDVDMALTGLTPTKIKHIHQLRQKHGVKVSNG